MQIGLLLGLALLGRTQTGPLDPDPRDPFEAAYDKIVREDASIFGAVFEIVLPQATAAYGSSIVKSFPEGSTRGFRRPTTVPAIQLLYLELLVRNLAREQFRYEFTLGDIRGALVQHAASLPPDRRQRLSSRLGAMIQYQAVHEALMSMEPEASTLAEQFGRGMVSDAILAFTWITSPPDADGGSVRALPGTSRVVLADPSRSGSTHAVAIRLSDSPPTTRAGLAARWLGRVWGPMSVAAAVGLLVQPRARQVIHRLQFRWMSDPIGRRISTLARDRRAVFALGVGLTLVGFGLWRSGLNPGVYWVFGSYTYVVGTVVMGVGAVLVGYFGPFWNKSNRSGPER